MGVTPGFNGLRLSSENATGCSRNEGTANGTCIVVDNLHSCYSHALLEGLVFWYNATKNWKRPWTLWVKRKHFDKWPQNDMKMVSKDGKYKGALGYVVERVLRPSRIVFEHLEANAKKPTHDGVQELDFCCFQRKESLWDDGRVYPGRKQRTDRIEEAVLLEPYREFRSAVLETMERTEEDGKRRGRGLNCTTEDQSTLGVATEKTLRTVFPTAKWATFEDLSFPDQV